MTPYYAEDGITIYHGDCRELVPTLTYGSVITDPPYGTGYYQHDTDAFTPAMLTGFATTVPTAVFGYPEAMVKLCVAAGIVPDEWVTWWPTNAAIKTPPSRGLSREAEVVAVFGEHRLGALREPRTRPLHAWVGPRQRGGNPGDPDTRLLGDVWTTAAPGIACQSHLRQHPNEKPMGVMHRLVAGVGVDTILDPFCGSGTTLRAAKDAGHQAIGIDIDEAHCATAARRLAQGTLEFGTA
jgi:site-specific DNA-methyltransferase (adenine-specific)